MTRQPFPSVAFLWPALAAASAGEVATAFAKQLARIAGPGGGEAEAVEAIWTTDNRVALELPTMRLRDFSLDSGGLARLVCAPFALHHADIADFAPGHSLIAALQGAGLRRLFLTHWRSATTDMQFLSIDSYLAELNVAVDALGGRVDLIGLCQGGWMALLFAARFPTKVRRLVLAGAPVDIEAGASTISQLASTLPLSVFKQLVRLGGGRVLGEHVLELWGGRLSAKEAIRRVLQISTRAPPADVAALEARFRDWYARTVDLPGRYYLEVVDWLFKQNRLAEGRMLALGCRTELATMRAPVFLLAASDDELVAPAQVFAAAGRIGTPEGEIHTAVAQCQHLSLFMGARTLTQVWPKIVHWLLRDRPASRASRARANPVVAPPGKSAQAGR